MDDLFALSLTLFILMVMLIYLGITMKFRKAYTKRFELIYHGGVPLLVFFGFQACMFVLGWSIWTLLLFLEVFANGIFAAINYNNDSFLVNTLNLKFLNRRAIFLYYFLEATDEFDAQIYQWTKHSTSFTTVVKIIEDNKLDQQERGQFESDEAWDQYCKFKNAYAAHKANADQYRVEVLGFTDIFSGFKMLLYVHPDTLNDHVLQGNAVRVPVTITLEGRTFEKIVCFEGKEDIEIQRHLDSAVAYLDILSSIPLLASIPNLQLQIAALQQINKDQRDTMEKNKFQAMLANEYAQYSPTVPPSIDMKLIMKLITGAMILAIGLVVTFILLSVLGVI
jgi:hypothetical protein